MQLQTGEPLYQIMLARYYGAGVGRFISADPSQKLGRNLSSPQRWNRFAYTLNNPLKYFDPDGLDVEVGANMRSAVAHGYQHSGDFRSQFDAAKSNPNVHVKIEGTGPVAKGRADFRGDPPTLARDSAGKRTGGFVVTGTASIPAGQGPTTSAALIGHELKHVNDIAATGAQPPGTPKGEKGEARAQETEKAIKEDLAVLGDEDDVSDEATTKALAGTEPKKPEPKKLDK